MAVQLGLLAPLVGLGKAAIANPLTTASVAGNVATVGLAGAGIANATSLPNTWTREAASGLNIGGDYDATYDALPFYKKWFVSEDALKQQVAKDEKFEIQNDPRYSQYATKLGAKLPEIRAGQKATDYWGSVGDVEREVDIERAAEKSKRDFFSLPNQYLMQQAELRRTDDINRRADERIHNMQMYRMGLEQQDRRDRRDAKMQLVAALTGSLSNLGDAFLSI